MGNQLKFASAVDARDVSVHLLYHSYIRSSTVESRSEAAKSLQTEVSRRGQIDARFRALTIALFGPSKLESNLYDYTAVESGLRNFKCLNEGNAMIAQFCGGYDDYSLRYSHVIANACERLVPVPTITAAIRRVCGMTTKSSDDSEMDQA